MTYKYSTWLGNDCTVFLDHGFTIACCYYFDINVADTHTEGVAPVYYINFKTKKLAVKREK